MAGSVLFADQRHLESGHKVPTIILNRGQDAILAMDNYSIWGDSFFVSLSFGR